MNIEQAIKHGQEQIDIFGGEHKEFIKVAIKSLDMWDKVIKEINIYCENNCKYSKIQRNVMCGACGVGDVLEIIENYKEEIEE